MLPNQEIVMSTNPRGQRRKYHISQRANQISPSGIRRFFDLLALIEVKLTPEKDAGFDSIAERIYRFPQTRSVYLVSGTYDLFVLAVGKTNHEVADFVSQKLSHIEGVQETVTQFVLKRYKEDGEIVEGKEEVKRQPVML